MLRRRIIAHFDKANALLKASRAAQGERFESAGFSRWIDKIISKFSAQCFLERREWGESSELPVFIVGMPRSGTSLLEQIVASHHQVFGAGERKDIGRICLKLGEGNMTAVEKWTEQTARKAAKEHLEHLQLIGGDAARVIDKMPDNVQTLGQIAILFPGARVIFCRRDARDNCLSCYFQWLTDAGNVFTNDLADCGQRYLGIERLIHHWQSVLPIRMLEVHYEELVSDLEGQSRRLIDFLGLPWDSRCLEFHKTKRPVLTASVWQVRQPIYNSSVGRWRHYEKHLGPLRGVLGEREGPW
jgi:hypothetical protein